MKLNSKQRTLLIIGMALLVLAAVKLALIGWYWHKKQASGPAPVQVLACQIERGSCTLPDGGKLIFLEPPRYGQPFAIRVEGVSGAAPSAEFTMPEMDMGFNRYRFVADGANWRANVTLPVCVTGSHHWEMLLEVDGRRYKLPFTVQ